MSPGRSQLFTEGKVNIGEYSPIFTEPEASNCFSIITQVIIREKQGPSENVYQFCLFVSNCHASIRLPITCPNEIIWSIVKLHIPQAECQYS